MKARTPFEELASAIAAHKDPLAQAMEAIDPVPLRALRQQQDEPLGQTAAQKAIAEALRTTNPTVTAALGLGTGAAAATMRGHRRGDVAAYPALGDDSDRLQEQIDRATATILSDPAPYRSPVRDVLDQMRAHPGIKPANPGRHVSATALPARGAGEAIPITSAIDIGRRVREVRRGMGITQQRFADMAGVGRRFLIELEQGKASLEIGRVLAVCQAAGIRLGIVA